MATSQSTKTKRILMPMTLTDHPPGVAEAAEVATERTEMKDQPLLQEAEEAEAKAIRTTGGTIMAMEKHAKTPEAETLQEAEVVSEVDKRMRVVTS